MLRVSRLTDYGIILLGHLTQEDGMVVANTRDLADLSGLPMSTVSKILKLLAKSGLLVSHRGVHGGYALARPPAQISIEHVYMALEGPIEVTQGGVGADTPTPCCIGGNWQLINAAVRGALGNISLLDMVVGFQTGSGEHLNDTGRR